MQKKPYVPPHLTEIDAKNVKRILIVDDDSNVRAAVRKGFESRGYVCDEADNGFQAIARAKEFGPHAIVLDLAMPAMNGFEAAMVLQREMPKMPVVILTMYADDAKFSSSLAHTFGVQGIIPKSEGVNAVMDYVHKLLT